MTSTTVLIGGATGATGSVATKLLLKKGFPVRAFVHKDDERAHKLQAPTAPRSSSETARLPHMNEQPLKN